MKYLFINSVAGVGSTGRIVADTCRELMSQGHTCLIAYGREKANCDDISTVQIGDKFDYRIHGLRTRLFDDHGFGSYGPTVRFLQRVREYDPDVIWLHNLHGYYIHIGLLFDFLKTCGKEIRWTLHDCWSFTGHCAYFDYAGCSRWLDGCYNCPQKGSYPASMLFDRSRKNYGDKRALFTGIPSLTLITPSQWLADLVKRSYLKEYPVEVIYNKINSDVFKPSQSDFRLKYGLEDKKIILGVASIWEKRKGLDDFLSLRSLLDDRFSIVLVGLNREQLDRMPEGILGIQRTNSARELAEIYTAADVFFNPTYEDNYPTVNLEAQACGTQVISYDTGGCAETLNDTGILIPVGNIDEAVAAIMMQTSITE